MEEAHGKLPIIAGTWALTSNEMVATAKDCKALGVDGIFVTPPGGRSSTSLPAGMRTAILKSGSTRSLLRTVRPPTNRHPPGGGAKPPFYPGRREGGWISIRREVPNVVGWKMTYMYDGFRIIAKGLLVG